MNPYPNEDTRTIFLLVFTYEHEGVTTKVKIKKIFTFVWPYCDCFCPGNSLPVTITLLSFFWNKNKSAVYISAPEKLCLCTAPQFSSSSTRNESIWVQCNRAGKKMHVCFMIFFSIDLACRYLKNLCGTSNNINTTLR